MKIGTKVKVTHNPAHDGKYHEDAQIARRANSGRVGEVVHLRGAGECPAFAVDTGSGVLACYEADELAPVPEYQPSDHVRAITRAAEGLDRVVTVARENAALWRADVDALQAAIRGLTGKGGTVASMVIDLADIARDMAALKAAVEAATGKRRDKVVDLIADLCAMGAAWVEAERREAAAAKASEEATIALAKEQSVRRGAVEARDVLDARLQVSARVASALRTLLRDGDALSVLRCLDDLDKALRGMPLGETRGRQGERFHAERVTRAEVAPDRSSGSLQDRLAEVERRLTISEEMHTAHADHFGLLDQRVAGLGNGLDEVRRPKVALFATERGDLRAYCDRGDQVGGASRRDDVWDWYSRRPFEAPTAGYDVPTREEALAAMTRVLETWAEIVDGAPSRDDR